MVINPYKMRTMTNNKILKSMAALVFVGAMTAGCSSDDLTAETPQPADAGKTVVMKITISLSESASTRALTEAGVKTFAMGDQIAVIYKNTAGETVKVESAALLGTDLYDAGQNATFSVVLTNPEPSTAVRYIYPASMAAAAVATDVATNDDATINYAALATQDGTLATIASTLDLAVFDGTLTDQAALPPATLENPLTIGKFTINNSGGTDITNTITKLTINDGTNTYTVIRTAAAGPIYVAMKPIASTQTVTVNAEDESSNYYMKVVAGKELNKNNIYPVNLTMSKMTVKNLSGSTNYTASNNDIISGNFTGTITIPDGATVVLNDVNSGQISNNSYIVCEGSTNIIFTGDNYLNAPDGSNHPAIYVPQNKSLSISGTGLLTVKSKGGAGIGAGHENLPCGDINILGGDINANSTTDAGIGAGGAGSTCGKITITGGNIEAAADNGASAAIGGGSASGSSSITITSGVNSLTVKGAYFICNSSGGVVGDVTIDGTTSFSFETSDTQFEHFKSVHNTESENTWTLTHK